jgi:rhamnose utilization protein RhaD (predicted bifunctional aldolase and dehydrogenase)
MSNQLPIRVISCCEEYSFEDHIHTYSSPYLHVAHTHLDYVVSCKQGSKDKGETDKLIKGLQYIAIRYVLSARDHLTNPME